MEILRTPEERFDHLAGWPYARRDVDVGGLRMAYVDEGAGSAVLLLHGEPTWGYLYRKMIPLLARAGLRAVVPDLIGFGRSDKPAEREAYTLPRHLEWMTAFIRALDLREIHLVGHDWGGIIGLRLVAGDPERFASVVATNTFLPTGRTPISPEFLRWRAYSQETRELPAGRIIQGACQTVLPPEVLAAYDAPFPDQRYQAGARQFPLLVPIAPDDPEADNNQEAWDVLRRFRKPFLTAFSDSDPITRGGDVLLRAAIPGAQGTTITGAGHFLQEDKGEELGRAVVDFIRRGPAST